MANRKLFLVNLWDFLIKTFDFALFLSESGSFNDKNVGSTSNKSKSINN